MGLLPGLSEVCVTMPSCRAIPGMGWGWGAGGSSLYQVQVMRRSLAYRGFKIIIVRELKIVLLFIIALFGSFKQSQ